MSIREKLKQREEKRDQAANGGPSDLPEGVTRYVRLSQELKSPKTFVIIADPDSWFWYYTHEDSQFSPFEIFVKKHTCLHNPRKLGEDFDSFTKKNTNACISCKAGVKRKLYFFMPVYDVQYKTWRVLDLKEFHAMNLIEDYDKIEASAKKFVKGYSLVGDAVTIGKTSDGKSYTMGSAETENIEDLLEDAKQYIEGYDFEFEELANFRDESTIIELLQEAHKDHADKSVLPKGDNDEVKPIEDGAEADPTDQF